MIWTFPKKKTSRGIGKVLDVTELLRALLTSARASARNCLTMLFASTGQGQVSRGQCQESEPDYFWSAKNKEHSCFDGMEFQGLGAASFCLVKLGGIILIFFF